MYIDVAILISFVRVCVFSLDNKIGCFIMNETYNLMHGSFYNIYLI